MGKTAEKPGKRGRPPVPDKKKSVPLSASIPAPLLAVFDRWRARQAPPLNRSQAVAEAIRRLVV